jgi:hypothetical protein
MITRDATHAISDEYVDVILRAAAGDRTLASVLREICGLEAAVRQGALDVVGAHLRLRDARADVLECVDALRQDDVARRIVERLAREG